MYTYTYTYSYTPYTIFTNYGLSSSCTALYNPRTETLFRLELSSETETVHVRYTGTYWVTIMTVRFNGKDGSYSLIFGI